MTKDKILRIAIEAGKAAAEKKAEDIVVLDLRGISGITDFFIICSASTHRQTRAIVQAIDERLAGFEARLDHIEGYPDGIWILMDYTDIVVHIFTKEAREYYALEHLWGDAPRVGLIE
ncbi:ribosome silencing factor [bacterium]|nr:ribosome silencing factor [bacterium]